ncbi:MAG: WD40 repeat domain-containing protein [Chthoniobacterales bacterium]
MNARRRFFLWVPGLVVFSVACALRAGTAEKLADLRGAFRVSFNHDASRVFAISREGALTIWALPAGTPVSGDLDPGAPAAGFVMSSDGELVVVGFKDAHCRVFDANTAKVISPVLDFQMNPECPMPALFAPDGNAVLLFGHKKALVFEIPSGKKIATLSFGEGISEEATGSAIFTADGTECFFMDGGGTVTCYNTKDWKPKGSPMPHPKAEAAYDFGFTVSDDQKWLATYDDPGENGPKSNLQVWDATTSKPVGKPLVAINGMTGRFVGNNRLLILPGRGAAAVRDLPSLKVAYTLRAHDDVDAPSAAVSSDRKWILVWGADHGLDLIDAASGKLAHTNQGPARIAKVLMLPDSSGCYVLFDNSAFLGRDNYDFYVVRISFPELEIRQTLRITNFVEGITLSPDGKRLVIQQGPTDQERLLFYDAASLKPAEAN